MARKELKLQQLTAKDVQRLASEVGLTLNVREAQTLATQANHTGESKKLEPEVVLSTVLLDLSHEAGGLPAKPASRGRQRKFSLLRRRPA